MDFGKSRWMEKLFGNIKKMNKQISFGGLTITSLLVMLFPIWVFRSQINILALINFNNKCQFVSLNALAFLLNINNKHINN
jgi:hypothetical protein